MLDEEHHTISRNRHSKDRKGNGCLKNRKGNQSRAIIEKNRENSKGNRSCEISEKDSENKKGSQSREIRKKSGRNKTDNISSDGEMDEEKSRQYYYCSGNNDDNIFMKWGEFETEMIMKEFALKRKSHPLIAGEQSQTTDPSDDYDAYVRRIENMSSSEWIAEVTEELCAEFGEFGDF